MPSKAKVAVITGSGSGNGAAIALRLAEDGFAIASVDLDVKAAAETAARIEKAGGTAVAFQCDVADAESVAAMGKAVKKQFGAVSVLVNNAGIGLWGTAETSDEREWDLVIAVNVKGVFLISRAILPLMANQQGASIINIGSGAGIIGVPNSLAYCASKGALHSMTRAMAMDHAAAGIRVNTVAPGVVDTPFNDKILAGLPKPKEVRLAQEKAHPLGRLATPGDVANAVAFLASSQSAFVTGSTVMVDGGLTAQ